MGRIILNSSIKYCPVPRQVTGTLKRFTLAGTFHEGWSGDMLS